MNPRSGKVAVVLAALLCSPARSWAQAGCTAELGAVQADLRLFESGSRQLGGGFLSAADLDRDISAWRQGGGGDLSKKFMAWNGRVSNWQAAVRAYSNCLGAQGCDIGQQVNQANVSDPEVGKWLSSLVNGMADSAQKSSDAGRLLDDYLDGAGRQFAGTVAKALSCLASLPAAPTPQPASPTAAAPPALPPPTVKQNLRWDGPNFDPKIAGTCTPGQPFRFSLCENKFLGPNDESAICTPRRTGPIISGGHPAPYVFSQGHGQFLPKGLTVDGNGILSGKNCDTLMKADRLPLCVKQLDSERCGVFGKDRSAESVKKGGGGAGKAVAALLIVGGGIAGGAALAGKVADSTGSSSGGSSGGGGMTFVGATGLTCFTNSGGVVSRCSGTFTVNITSKIASGSRLKLLTQGAMQSDIVTNTSSPPGTMTFPISGGSGACPPPVTELNLLNTSVSTSNIVAQVSGLSLRVACQ